MSAWIGRSSRKAAAEAMGPWGGSPAESSEPPARPARNRPVPGDTSQSKVEALWDELKPKDRDFIYMAIGMAVVFLFMGILALLIGHTFWYLIFFLIGAGVGPFLER